MAAMREWPRCSLIEAAMRDRVRIPQAAGFSIRGDARPVSLRGGRLGAEYQSLFSESAHASASAKFVSLPTFAQLPFATKSRRSQDALISFRAASLPA